MSLADRDADDARTVMSSRMHGQRTPAAPDIEQPQPGPGVQPELAADEVDLLLRSPDVGFPITELALYIPPGPRSAPEKTRFKLPQRDPYLKEYIAATSAFDAMVRVTPARLRAFIDEKIGDQDQIRSTEISIDSIQDLFAFRSLPMGVFGESKVFGPYRVVVEEGRTDNEWINVPAFRIERIAAERAA